MKLLRHSRIAIERERLSRLRVKLLRTVRGRLHPATYQAIRRRLRRSLSRGPLVSVVIPTYNVEEYLSELLDSVLTQNYGNLQIVIVDDGSSDGSLAISREYARRDRRIQVIVKENEGLGAARNTGLTVVRGNYLMFLDSDDRLASGAIELMVTTLLKTGSDFAVGAVARFDSKRTWRARWNSVLHSTDRLGIQVSELPDILLDVFAWNKLWNTQFFLDQVGGYTEGKRYEDQMPSVMAYCRATSFDVLERVVYYWRCRENGTSITQQKTTFSDLDDRMSVTAGAGEIVQAEAPSEVQRAWLHKTFDFDIAQYIRILPRVGNEYWERLHAACVELFEKFGERCFDDLDIEVTLLLWYTITGNREAVFDVLSDHIEFGKGYSLLDDGRGQIRAVPALVERHEHRPPDHLLTFDEAASDVSTGVTGIFWITDTEVVIEGYAVPLSSLRDSPDYDLELHFENSDGVQSGPLQVERFTDPRLNAEVRSEWRAPEDCGFRVRVNTEDLSPESRAHVLRGSVTVGGVQKAFAIDRVQAGGAAELPSYAGVRGGSRWVTKHSPGVGLCFLQMKVEATVDRWEIKDRELTLRVASRVGGARLSAIVAEFGPTHQRCKGIVDSAGQAVLRLPALLADRSPGLEGYWSFRGLMSDGRKVKLFCRSSASDAGHNLASLSRLTVAPSRRGQFRLLDAKIRTSVTEFDFEEDSGLLTVSYTVDSAGPVTWAYRLTGPKVSLSPESVEQSAERSWKARFKLTDTQLGTAVPSGGYTLRAYIPFTEEGRVVEKRAKLAAADTGAYPSYAGNDLIQLKTTRTAQAGSFWLRIGPPRDLRADQTMKIREAIDRSSEDSRTSLKDSVVFETFHGAGASDSVLAIFEEVRRRFPGLDLYWSVKDLHSHVPEGASPLVIGLFTIRGVGVV